MATTGAKLPRNTPSSRTGVVLASLRDHIHQCSHEISSLEKIHFTRTGTSPLQKKPTWSVLQSWLTISRMAKIFVMQYFHVLTNMVRLEMLAHSAFSLWPSSARRLVQQTNRPRPSRWHSIFFNHLLDISSLNSALSSRWIGKFRPGWGSFSGSPTEQKFLVSHADGFSSFLEECRRRKRLNVTKLMPREVLTLVVVEKRRKRGAKGGLCYAHPWKMTRVGCRSRWPPFWSTQSTTERTLPGVVQPYFPRDLGPGKSTCIYFHLKLAGPRRVAERKIVETRVHLSDQSSQSCW